MDGKKKYAVIVAGGKGVRMNNAVPKQFLPLAGKPVLYYSIKAFTDAYADINVILVLPEDQMSYAQMVLQCFETRIDVTIVAGGETRYHSVQNGLKQVDEGAIVFVHDGVRPLVTAALIKQCGAQAEEWGSAIPAIAMVESVRVVDGNESKPINRENLRVVQTPQTFRSEIILKAFEQEYDAAFTDEATVVAAGGTQIHLIAGERQNIKVTTQEDMIVAAAYLSMVAKENESHDA